MPDRGQTPADVAKNEAARQAVMLIFGALTLLALMPLQRRMMDQLTRTVTDQHDPSGAARKRMQDAQQGAGRWDRAARLLWTYGPARAALWAHRRAEAARQAYEQERLS